MFQWFNGARSAETYEEAARTEEHPVHSMHNMHTLPRALGESVHNLSRRQDEGAHTASLHAMLPAAQGCLRPS